MLLVASLIVVVTGLFLYTSEEVCYSGAVNCGPDPTSTGVGGLFTVTGIFGLAVAPYFIISAFRK
jgi:hypothetical protein